jgi:amino-acid N-acetyltransferase
MTEDSFLHWFRTTAPYFNAHRGRNVVIHVDGQVLLAEGVAELVHDVALLHGLGVRVVLVFGARAQVAQRLRADGLDESFVDSVRCTSAQAMTALRQAVAELSIDLQARLSMGLVNSPMHGARIRVCSGNFITARPFGVHAGVDHGLTGQVRRVDTAAILRKLEAEEVVLIPPIGFSPTGEVFNLLSTDLAAQVAVAMKAYKLVMLAPDGAVLRDGERLSSLSLSETTAWLQSLPADLEPARRQRYASAVFACRNGVPRVHLLDASVAGAMARELYSREGSGTMLNADGYHAVRRARLEDLGGLLELLEPLERTGALVRRSRADIERTIDHYFVDEYDGAVVACAAAHPFSEESAVELACLAVHADHRGAGRGDLLLSCVQTEARRLNARTLFVLTTGANHWFKERGFVDADLADLPVARQALYNDQRGSQVLLKQL